MLCLRLSSLLILPCSFPILLKNKIMGSQVFLGLVLGSLGKFLLCLKKNFLPQIWDGKMIGANLRAAKVPPF